MSLLFTGQPEPPRDLRVSDCTSHFVELTWIRPTMGEYDCPIIEYIIYYTDSSTEDPDVVVEGENVTIKEGLTPMSPMRAILLVKPWVRYQFYVAARNALGTSEKTNQSAVGTPAVCSTPPTAPTSNPEDVCVRLGPSNQLNHCLDGQMGFISQYICDFLGLLFSFLNATEI